MLILNFALDLADFKVFLLQFLIQLLFIIFQVHYAIMGQLQVSFKFPLSSLEVHAQLLLLLQGPFQIVHLLLQLGFSFGQRIDFVFLYLQVIQCLLMGLLEGFLLFCQLGNCLIQDCHLLCEVFHLVFSGMLFLLNFGQC